MKKFFLISGILISCSVMAQNVKIQSKKNGIQVKVKDSPARAHHTQIKTENTKVQINTNPSGTKIKVKNHPPKGSKK